MNRPAPLQPRGRGLCASALAACVGVIVCLGVHAEDPWADGLVSYNAIDPNVGFDTPEKTLGEPVGGGTYSPNNSSLHSIGRPGASPGSYITLRFDTPVTDDPDNPMGLDCIVYGNVFWTGGDPERKWCEPGLIEISQDVNGNGLADDPWYVIPGSRFLDQSVLPGGISNPTPPLAGNVANPNTDGTEYDWGYCELTPTQRKCRDNYVRPDDPNEVGLTLRSGGGDAFDIAWAVPVDGTGDPSGITQFDFIRLSAFIDMMDGAFGYITPEIDAVADVAPDVDNDADDILDEYETRVAGTDPARPESTVLALEIPSEDGGSPAGAELGTASDAQGNAITLFSTGTRSGTRNYNCIVDILTVTDPAPGVTISGLEKSGAVREYQSSEADFSAAQVQDGQFTVAYTSAEIIGLDEPGLQPFRFDGSAFTQDGISAVIKDTALNLLTFRSTYPGTFILASTAGDGDIDTGADPIVLYATPPQGAAGDPGTAVSLTSDLIYLPDETLVPDGTYFTVATTLGQVTSTDADPGTAGVQIAAASGAIAFGIEGTTTAGTASITAISLDGVLHGELEYLFAAGDGVGPVDIHVLDYNPVAPGPVSFSTDPILDTWGNPLDAGALVTLVVHGGDILTADAAPSEPGHQLALTSGVANFTILVDTEEGDEHAALTVALYGDPSEMQMLGQDSYSFVVAQMPLGMTGLLALAVLLAGLFAQRRIRVRA